MSRNFVDLERQLIEDLERRTGRSLEAWMAAIDAAHLEDKNAVIDWLRPQGFTFANASWLERIHNNAGKPIYLGQIDAPRRIEAPPPQAAPPRPTLRNPTPSNPLPASQTATNAAPPGPAPAASPRPKPPAAANPQPVPPAAASASALAATLARGKAYRPLAELLVRTIARTLPGVETAVENDVVRFCNPREFATLHVTAKELRLGLGLVDTPVTSPLLPSRLTAAPPWITHMLVLTDARQVGDELAELLRVANATTNPPPPGAETDH